MTFQSLITDYYDYALKSNSHWASFKNNQCPNFFHKLKAGQDPKILWIGCSDSRVPETTILGLQPGDVFVHRNIANVIPPSDVNITAVIEYAVEHLNVMHIMVCGHTDCGGAKAALSDNRVGGVLDTWIRPLVTLRRANKKVFDAIKDDDQKAVKLAELNVEAGVCNLLNNGSVIQAIEERGLRLHGCMFDLSTGKIRDLNCGGCTTDDELCTQKPWFEEEKAEDEDDLSECVEFLSSCGDNCGARLEQLSPTLENLGFFSNQHKPVFNVMARSDDH